MKPLTIEVPGQSAPQVIKVSWSHTTYNGPVNKDIPETRCKISIKAAGDEQYNTLIEKPVRLHKGDRPDRKIARKVSFEKAVNEAFAGPQFKAVRAAVWNNYGLPILKKRK